MADPHCEHCGNCVYYFVDTGYNTAASGYCRRYPPRIKKGPTSYHIQVGQDDWCGEWSYYD